MRRFASNLAAILTSDVLNRGTTFLAYILVARYLGTYAFGQMSLALILFYSFQVVATFGMQTLITREVAKNPDDSAKYFTSSLCLTLVASVAATLLLAGAVILLDYPAQTRDLILVTSLGLVPFAMGTICEAVIRGREKMHLIAFVQVPVNVLKVVAIAYLLWIGGTILQVIILIVICRFIIAAAMFLMTSLLLRPLSRSRFDFAFAQSIARRSTTFVGIDVVTAWWASLNVVLLSKFATETEVGLYNAAAQLMIPLGIFYQSVMVAAFPIMCRKFASASDGLNRVANRLIELLLLIAVPGTIGLIMVAEPALEFVYEKQAFSGAADVVRITAFILILKALTFALGHVLLAGSRETTTLRIVCIDLFVNLILGLVLISQFGLIGAAVAALLTRIVDFAQHLGPVRKIVTQIKIGRCVWKPFLAGAAMAAYLILVRDQHLIFCIVSAAIVYFCVFLAMELWVAGSVQELKARYL
jgi:O-antigen/teichoic acid export membrane protein